MNIEDEIAKLNLNSFNGTVGSIISGFNTDYVKPALPKSFLAQGYTFFTRTDCNLSDGNLNNDRRFKAMLDVDSGNAAVNIAKGRNSFNVHKMIRHMLDPDQYRKYKRSVALFDDRHAFIPVLTNTLESLSAPPDESANVQSSPEGNVKEVTLHGDGISKIYGQFTLTATFNNIPTDIVTWLFTYLLHYRSNVLYDHTVFVSKLTNILRYRKDYEMGIYRLIMDSTGTYVAGISYTVGIAENSPRGLLFAYDRNKENIEDGDTISINFSCQGIEYDDPILYYEFNYKVALSNPSMRDYKPDDGSLPTEENIDNIRHQTMAKVDRHELAQYNYTVFPRINPVSLELEWWRFK